LTAIDILTAIGSMADFLNLNSRTIVLLAEGVDVMTELSELPPTSDDESEHSDFDPTTSKTTPFIWYRTRNPLTILRP
jgi:hypothetical protein